TAGSSAAGVVTASPLIRHSSMSCAASMASVSIPVNIDVHRNRKGFGHGSDRGRGDRWRSVRAGHGERPTAARVEAGDPGGIAAACRVMAPVLRQPHVVLTSPLQLLAGDAVQWWGS